jgi:transposase
MFIRKTLKTDSKTLKKYFSYQLVEAYRTEKGPRQHILMTINHAQDLSNEERKLLANRIEELAKGINNFLSYPEHIESLAQSFSKQLVHKKALPNLPVKEKKTDYTVVDLNTVDNENARGIGVEHISLETIRKLELPQKLEALGFTPRQIELTIAVIIGRLAGNVSELSTYDWMQEITGLDELIETSFQNLSLKSVYKVSDDLYKVKSQLEDHLRYKETHLFALNNTIALYDLTNIYFEGQVKAIKKAKKGRSKDRRSDCPLMTLGVVFNQDGFPIVSDMFEGNVSEPKTLEKVLSRLKLPNDINPIVVLDAGIATEDNLTWLRSLNYSYIVCSRKRNHTIPADLKLQPIKTKNHYGVQAACKKDEASGETLVFCQSEAKQTSEEGWQTTIRSKFEKQLQKISTGLSKKGYTKVSRIISERIGRLKKRYSRIAQFYTIDLVIDSNQCVQTITWKFKEEEALNRFDGGYCLRVHGLDWNCQRLWETYIMLTKAEDGFRNLKSHLGIRPVYHSKENRADGHLFITLLAYHVMRSILFQLEEKGIIISWKRLRQIMSTHIRITTSFTTKEAQRVHIRTTCNPESFHKKVYTALGLNPKPGKRTKTIL